MVNGGWYFEMGVRHTDLVTASDAMTNSSDSREWKGFFSSSGMAEAVMMDVWAGHVQVNEPSDIKPQVANQKSEKRLASSR